MQSKEMLNKSPEINLKQLKNQLLIPETEEIKKKNIENIKRNNKTIIKKQYKKFQLHKKLKKNIIKVFKCPYENCNKQYYGIARLNIHLRTHTGEKPFKCSFPGCNKSFNEKGNLKTHFRIHTGEKPFICNYPNCNAAFKAKGHLNDHLKIHSKIKPYHCNICGKDFSRSSTLKIHQYTHSKEKPFKCSFPNCQRQFTEKGNMISHLKTHFNNFKNESFVNNVNMNFNISSINDVISKSNYNNVLYNFNWNIDALYKLKYISLLIIYFNENFNKSVMDCINYVENFLNKKKE